MEKKHVTFSNAKEMLAYIQDGNDLYSPTEELYVSVYNDMGSVC